MARNFPRFGKIIGQLLDSEEPSIRYKVRVGVLGERRDSQSIRKLREQIRRSPRVRQLLSRHDAQGRIEPVRHVYRKWVGAHWVLPALADLGYPPGDRKLQPVFNQVFDCWLADWTTTGVEIINGRARRCASQQGNALYAALALGVRSDRVHRLAELLMTWQWPDGGWNCDRNPKAHVSSFHESILPLRSLSLYARVFRSRKAAAAAKRAAELFLCRKLFKGRRSGKVIDPDFILAHYPCYWHYDFLMGLKVMAEAGFVRDRRCGAALDLLESKQLPDGGWAAEDKYWRSLNPQVSNADLVSWGPVGRKKMNEWITADALAVLAAAGRIAK